MRKEGPSGYARPPRELSIAVRPIISLRIAYRDPLTAFAPFRDRPMSLLLHGNGESPAARWSYLLAEPDAVFAGAEHVAADAFIRAHAGNDGAHGEAPFRGGVAGLFCYEFSAGIDPAMPQCDAEVLPAAALGHYPTVAAFDHAAKQAFVFAPSEGAALAFAAKLGTVSTLKPYDAGGRVAALDSSANYEAAVMALIARIRAGDLFQANLSRRFVGRLGAGDHPYEMFARLCVESPAPFGAYLRLPDAAIVSNSPERLVSLEPSPDGWLARTSPIKGTRPRGRDEGEDRALAQALIESEKDRAENLMIVDLMRNDISRVSVPGTVRAPRLFEIESYANVHHLVSTVEGRLKPGLGALELMRAVFPAGSITGAPKIKAMEMIRAAEAAPRHACYGSIAWFGADGAMDSNVLIRTAVCFEDKAGWDVSFRVGGGITIESDPAEEARETDDKAVQLLRAIRGAETLGERP